MRLLHGHTAEVMAVAFSPDGRTLASAGWDGSIRLWNLAGSGNCVCMRTGNDHAVSLAWSPDGEYLTTAFRNHFPKERPDCGDVARFRPRSDVPNQPPEIRSEHTWRAHSRGTSAVCYAPDGKRIATAGENLGGAVVQTWDLPEKDRTPMPLFLIPPNRTGKVPDIRFCPDGKELSAISHVINGRLMAWDLTKVRQNIGGELPHFEISFSGDRGNALTYSPNGITIVGAFESGRLVLWQPGENQVDEVRHAHAGKVTSVAYTPDGRAVLSAGADGLVKIWDAHTRALLRTFDWQLGDIGCVAVAPDGLTAAAGGNGVIVLWDLEE